MAIKKVSNFKSKMIVTVVTVLFLIHPSLTISSLSMFNCYNVGGEDYFSDNMDLLCWSSEHISWAIPIGLTMLLVWVIGFPLWGFCLLKRNKHKLDELEFSSKYRMFY